MTERMYVPDAEDDWEPATEPPGGPNPARQASMFQSAAWPLYSLALLSVDLDAVARRLRLTLETSWDGHGSVRAAFFVLDGTDFVATHHEGDGPGTHIWTRKGGPVDAATRGESLLAALGVGPEVVSYSSWGVGTDLSVIPPAWRRAGTAARKPVWSRQDFWENFRTHPDVFVARVNFESVTGFLSGYDVAVSGNLLDGFREWLAAKLGFGRNLVWSALILKLVFPEGRPAEPWSQEDDQHAVDQLIKLLDEYFESLTGDHPEADGEPQPSRPSS
ncbi:hypothetical protein [Streptomyces tauricus]|uniref:hypothetical protein n=1 Tax=Streptomyces tauricus TaxID=68274 RepID=UPI0022433328|nr:hypothetical protein [Streptomyces tauricus]MCW8100360.1 hypothetical protein [Streptomyces tauricus]